MVPVTSEKGWFFVSAMQVLGVSFSEVISAFDYAIESKHLSNEQRFLFSQRKLDFLEELGTDPGLYVLTSF